MSELDPQRLAVATLIRIAEPADAKVGEALERLGAQDLIAAIQSGTGGLSHGRALRLRLEAVDGAAEFARAAQVGARLVLPGEPDWPTQLDDLGPVRPYGLWVRGTESLRPALLRSVAMVGARGASAYGVHVATELAAGVAERGWTVVSGAALGIDSAAHRGALASGGTTIAVLAGGVDVLYPPSNAALIERIVDSGVVLSEAAFGAPPVRHRFLTRNRVIAALTRGTVVVEAAMRSGAATTARWADELGRTLMAVPGPVTSMVSAGSNDLLRSRQAVAVTRATEVIEDLGRLGDDLAPARRREARPHDALPERLAGVIEVLPARRPMPVAQVAAECGLDAAQAQARLGELAVLGMVERVEGGWRPTRLGRGLGP